MWFKLTTILVGLIFATMYFAGAPDETAALRMDTPEPAASTGTATTGGAAAEPEADAPPATRAAIRDLGPAAPEGDPGPDLAMTDPQAPSETADLSQRPGIDDASTGAQADQLPLSALALDALRIPTDGAAAVSLADRVRSRNGAAGIDTTRPSLTPPPPEPEIVIDTGGAPAGGRFDGGAAAGAQFATITGTNVNLRAGPSTGNAVVGQVQAGQRVRLIGETSPGWSTILDPDTGDPVFMSSRFLSTTAN